LKTILEASPVGMLVFDDGEMVIYANPQAEALFGRRLTCPGEIKCGDFITCANRHTDPQGCGHTPSCPNCPILLAIRSALSSDQPPALCGTQILGHAIDISIMADTCCWI